MKQYKVNGVPIFYKILISFWGSMIFIVYLWTAIYYFSSKAATEKNAEERIIQQMDVFAYAANNELQEELGREVRLLASSPSLDEYMASSEAERESNANKTARVFMQFIRHSPNYDSISFIDSSGMEKIRVTRNDRVKIYRDFKSSEIFTRLKPGVSGAIHHVGRFMDEHDHYIISVGISTTNADTGKFGGVIFVDYVLDDFIRTVCNIKVLDSNPVWILNSDGQALSQPANSRNVFDPRAYLSKNAQKESRLMVVDEGILIYQDIYSFSEKPLLRLVIAVSNYLLLKDIRLIARFLLIVSALALLLVTIMAYFISRQLSQPIIELARAATQLATGDFTSRAKVETSGEMRLLVDSFNLMAENIEKRTGELFEAQEELVRKEKLATLGQLSGSVGHELRNPLAVMSNAVFFLQTVLPDADETVREYLGIIKAEVNNSQRIITDLLDFTRTKTPQAKAITVDELIQQGLGKCAVPQGISLRVEIPDALPAVKVDPLQMAQVFQNLITNAFQAMPEGGELRISARKAHGSQLMAHSSNEDSHELSAMSYQPDGDFIEIFVTDTGEGIAPENMKKLFQPLFTTKARGIGLGLTVVKNLIEANGGRIEVESHLGKGTTFTVILPAAGIRL